MDFEIYCDEGGLEALNRKEEHLYSAIGGIWLPHTNRFDLKKSIKDIKTKHQIYGELKWNKVSPRYLNLYKDLIDFFFQADYKIEKILWK